MKSVLEAKQIIMSSLPGESTAQLELLEAFCFTLAEDVIASADIPNFAQSSMDGYAIRHEDREKSLTIIGEMAAGTAVPMSIGLGEATRIFTGAPLPDGADTVVMQERVDLKEGKLYVQDTALAPGQNVRVKGAEVRQGEIAMAEGTYLSAAAIGFLAGIGCTHVTVYAPPRVTIILTGNELQEPGIPLEFGQVYEANSAQLKAALQKLGIKDVEVLRAADDAAELQSVLQKALDTSAVVLLNGGVSVGDYDYVIQSAKACGVEQKFHKIAQKPGKPLYFGTKNEKLVFGLPGNPSSSLTCFYEYVLPALEKLMHLQASVITRSAAVTHDYPKPAGLTHFLKAYFIDGKVTPLHAQESFRLHSFAQANCFIVLPEDSTGCRAGDIVEVDLLPL